MKNYVQAFLDAYPYDEEAKREVLSALENSDVTVKTVPAPKAENNEKYNEYEKLYREIAALNVDELTPIAAMNLLYELKKRTMR